MKTAILVLVSLVTFQDKPDGPDNPEGWVSPKLKADAPKWAVNYFRVSELERLRIYKKSLEMVTNEKAYIRQQTKPGKTAAQKKHYAEIAKDDVAAAKKNEKLGATHYPETAPPAVTRYVMAAVRVTVGSRLPERAENGWRQVGGIILKLRESGGSEKS